MFYGILSQFLCAKFLVKKFAWAKKKIFLEGLSVYCRVCRESSKVTVQDHQSTVAFVEWAFELLCRTTRLL